MPEQAAWQTAGFSKVLRTMLGSPEAARRAAETTMRDIGDRLNESVVVVTKECSPEEAARYRRAVASIMAEVLFSVLNPLYSEHPSLKPRLGVAPSYVRRGDPQGTVTCYTYDALHRLTSVTYPSGGYASVTPPKYCFYDKATVDGVAMVKAMGRLAEAYTGRSTSKITDLASAIPIAARSAMCPVQPQFRRLLSCDSDVLVPPGPARYVESQHERDAHLDLHAWQGPGRRRVGLQRPEPRHRHVI